MTMSFLSLYNHDCRNYLYEQKWSEANDPAVIMCLGVMYIPQAHAVEAEASRPRQRECDAVLLEIEVRRPTEAH